MDRSALGRVRIAAPCSAEWKWMYGDDRVRFCSQCNLNVYNLSAMTREEAELLVLKAEDRLCVRFYRRKDGTVLTKNFSVGVQAIKDKLTCAKTRIIGAVLSLLAYLGAAGILQFTRNDNENGTLSVLAEKLGERPQHFMGALAPPADADFVERSEHQMRQRALLKVDPTVDLKNKKRVRGTVRVSITVNEAGITEDAFSTSGPEALMEAAKDAAFRWRFSPTFVNGSYVRVKSILTFHFK